MTIDELQRLVAEWSGRNFPAELTRKRLQKALGVCEEAGELAHAILKWDQGIRGTVEEHIAAAKDAIGGAVVYMMDLCATQGWSLMEIVEQTVLSVTKRDWTKDPKAGGIE